MRYGFDYAKNLDNMELFFREYLGLKTDREDRDSITVTIDPVENLRNRSDKELKERCIDPRFRKHPEWFFEGKDGAEANRIKIRYPQIGFSENRRVYDMEISGSPANRFIRYAVYFFEIGETRKNRRKVHRKEYGNVRKNEIETVETFLREKEREFLPYRYDLDSESMRYGFDYVRNLDNMELFFREYFGFKTVREDPESLKIYIDDPVKNIRNWSEKECVDFGIDPIYPKRPELLGDIKKTAQECAKICWDFKTFWALSKVQQICCLLYDPDLEIKYPYYGAPLNQRVYYYSIHGYMAHRIIRYSLYFVEVGETIRNRRRINYSKFGNVRKKEIATVENFLKERGIEYTPYDYDPETEV